MLEQCGVSGVLARKAKHQNKHKWLTFVASNNECFETFGNSGNETPFLHLRKLLPPLSRNKVTKAVLCERIIHSSASPNGFLVLALMILIEDLV